MSDKRMISFQLIKIDTQLECVRCNHCYKLFGMEDTEMMIQTFISLACKCHKRKIELSFPKDLPFEEKKEKIALYVQDLMEDTSGLELWDK